MTQKRTGTKRTVSSRKKKLYNYKETIKSYNKNMEVINDEEDLDKGKRNNEEEVRAM